MYLFYLIMSLIQKYDSAIIAYLIVMNEQKVATSRGS